MIDLVPTERALVRQKIELRRQYEQAKTAAGRGAWATARTAFLDTLAVFQQHGDAQVSDMIERVRDY